jgi:hypothetical protein
MAKGMTSKAHYKGKNLESMLVFSSHSNQTSFQIHLIFSLKLFSIYQFYQTRRGFATNSCIIWSILSHEEKFFLLYLIGVFKFLGLRLTIMQIFIHSYILFLDFKG